MRIQGVSNRVKIYSNYNNIAFKGATPPSQNNSVSDDKEISKEYAQACKSNLVTNSGNIPNLINLKLSEDLRTRPDLYTDSFVFSADQWPRNLLINDDLSKFYFDVDDTHLTTADDAFFNKQKIKDFLIKNPNGPKCFPVYVINKVYDELLGPDLVDPYFRVGVIFLSENLLRNYDETSGYLLYLPAMKRSNYFYGYDTLEGSNEAAAVYRMVGRGAPEYVINLEPEERKSRELLADYLVREGREDEALERFPELADYIENLTNKYKFRCSQNSKLEPSPLTLDDYLARGDLRGALFDETVESPLEVFSADKELLLKIADYINANNLLEKWIDKHKLGSMLFAGSQIRENRYLVDSVLWSMENARERVISNKISDAWSILLNAKCNEFQKNCLQRSLLKPIKDYKDNPNVDVPNSIMLYRTYNWEGRKYNFPFLAKNLIDWIEENYSEYVNLVKLPSKKDKVQMQEDLLHALEDAEKKYQETDRRSIIFVNGMEKLLYSIYNKPENIAVMKDLMSSASEDYHSTIIFYSSRPKGVDSGVHRSDSIGVKINVQLDGERVLDE